VASSPPGFRGPARSSPTAAASLVGLAIWFTILAIQRADISFTGRLTVAIVACALIAAIALALFAHPAEPFRGRWRFSGNQMRMVSAHQSGLMYGRAGSIVSGPRRLMPPQIFRGYQ
jgi:hypothetical protein